MNPITAARLYSEQKSKISMNLQKSRNMFQTTSQKEIAQINEKDFEIVKPNLRCSTAHGMQTWTKRPENTSKKHYNHSKSIPQAFLFQF